MIHYIELNGTSGLFTCYLDKSYILEGEWQVALIQIDISKEWKIDIEHRPKILNNPDYVKDHDMQTLEKMIFKITNEPNGHDHEINKNKLAVFLLNLINVELIKYKYNSAMEYLVKYIETELVNIIDSLNINRDNNKVTFNPIIKQLREIKILYASKYKTSQDGISQKALDGCDMYYNNNKIAENTRRFLVNPIIVKIDIINPDTCLRSITATQHDYNNLQFHKVTKNYFDSIRVEIQEPIKRTLQIENSPIYLRLQLKKIK
jgi:hypothetical protein